ncbi:MAG: YaeQ family protein, partial [Bdellovibrionota bacterium]
MAQTATLYRFCLDVSDIDRDFYESLDLRVAMHPSEIPHYLLTRILAFALNSKRGLEFSPGGLSDTDAPCIRCLSDNGTLDGWIEVGNPSARKLHKAAKAARDVKVYTYKDPKSLLEEIAAEKVHRA